MSAIIHTERPAIMLRHFSPEDSEALFALIDKNRDHLSRLGDTTASRYQTLDSVRDSIVSPPNRERQRFGIWRYHYGYHLLGSINLTPKTPRVAEIGYWIGKEFLRKGYASVAVKALSRHVFKETMYDVLYGVVHQHNLASILVLVRCGFIRDVDQETDTTYTYRLDRC